ncbi:hypothetical protein GCM10023185_06910 [Hymenobacter saemangeumensis]|uniref:N-acetylmuramidase domain-containing protein n=1 Tax=Hymenobacter saemangeumensis TaxID=1084522 RepID=A0ABP8I2B2_9BACT
MQRLTPAQIDATSLAAGFEPRAVRAVLQVECGGTGYAPNGWLLIQFEPSWFRRQLPPVITARIKQAVAAEAAKKELTEAEVALLKDWRTTQANGVEGQLRERMAFDAACRIDKRAALLSTSWGLPQMMGFNHRACGFATVEDMVEAFRQSEANQLAGMLRFIKSKPALAAALKAKDWGVLAYHYNGPAYKQFNYDRRLATAYSTLS